MPGVCVANWSAGFKGFSQGTSAKLGAMEAGGPKRFPAPLRAPKFQHECFQSGHFPKPCICRTPVTSCLEGCPLEPQTHTQEGQCASESQSSALLGPPPSIVLQVSPRGWGRRWVPRVWLPDSHPPLAAWPRTSVLTSVRLCFLIYET